MPATLMPFTLPDWDKPRAAECFRVEAWSRFADKPGDHTLRQIQAGEMRVSDLRPEDRTEVLMVSAQSRDGWSTSWIDEVVRDAAGKPSFGKAHAVADFQGRFGKLFG